MADNPYQGDDIDPFSAARDESAEEAQKLTFKQAFAEARRGGNKIFEWNGKKYTTQLAGEKPKSVTTTTVSGDGMGMMAGKEPRITSEEFSKMSSEDAVKGVGRPPRNTISEGRAVDKNLLNIYKRLNPGMKKGGQVKKMAKGGSVSSASKRADGCCVKGKTKGRIV